MLPLFLPPQFAWIAIAGLILFTAAYTWRFASHTAGKPKRAVPGTEYATSGFVDCSAASAGVIPALVGEFII